ncbi:MAG TPA: prepilin-type N-terminal cleavage/methylation domain-containing protein [Candidatus Paceibacterota bacterium]|nr:prepilin-type N-terminal cleavage/methylation domain-containing protein [Candidatus Paceibacterota bacterium]
MRAKRRGFTLIELLIVIGTIGVLASVIMASMASAREKARDARRIADLREAKVALEMYFDTYQSFPPSIGAPYTLPLELVATTTPYLPSMPRDPLGTSYIYIAATGTAPQLSPCTTAPCNAFALFALFERSDNQALTSDSDVSFSSIVSGISTDCGATAGAPQPGGDERCYDITP